MIMRMLVYIGFVVLGAGFIFFAANVIWLGTKEFFKIYGPKNSKNAVENNMIEDKGSSKENN